jgi:hypothetical protein
VVVYIVVGQSGSGKTTFVKNRWAVGEGRIVEEPIPHTIYQDGSVALVGRYGLDGVRTEGTDTLSYSALPRILDFIDRNHRRFDIVCEGDRINTPKFFEFLIARRIPAKLFLTQCSTSWQPGVPIL